MKIRIADIPPEGRELDFELDTRVLNERVGAVRARDTDSIPPPSYIFHSPTTASLTLTLEGATVTVKGEASGSFTTVCARCAEDTTKDVQVGVDIVLKPRPQRGPIEAEDEDISFGYYDEQEVDCSDVVEEFLVLALPFTVSCSDACKGLCMNCGANLNVETCRCRTSDIKDERFEALRHIKLN